jgi:OFA family oxalate/formate antiporter-like MFS transporter
MPRWIPLLGGVLASTCCGLILYAFSVFIKPLRTQFGWSAGDVSLAYALICLVYGLVSFPAGKLSDKYGPRIVVLAGGMIATAGFCLTSTITSKYQLYLYYGLLAGLGGGAIYLPPVAAVPKWWPDRKALATGFAVVGLGLGSFIMGPLATKLIERFGGALPVFLYAGIAIGILAIIASLCLPVPLPGWRPVNWNPPAPAAGLHNPGREYTLGETVKTPQFWLLYLAYFCGAFAGLIVIGHIAFHGNLEMAKAFAAAKGIGMDRESSRLIAMKASYAVSSLALCNALVRILIGAIVDKIGTRICFLCTFVLQAVALLALYPAGSNYLLLLLAAAVIGWNYGAMFTLFPATCVQYFGTKAQGANYGLLFTAWGLAGFAGPYTAGILLDRYGTYLIPFAVAAALVIIAVAVLLGIRPPKGHSRSAFSQRQPEGSKKTG